MAEVTGFTAERMLVIENTTVVDGEVQGDNLILMTREGTPIDAGNVRGPTGFPGVTQPEMDALLLAHIPVGVVLDYINPAVPAKFLAMIGQTIANGQTLYPLLWAVIPASMKSGANIIMPDTRQKVAIGYDSAAGGAMAASVGAASNALSQANLPSFNVSVNPPATTINVDPPNANVTVYDPGHTHRLAGETKINYQEHSHIPGADPALSYVVQRSLPGGAELAVIPGASQFLSVPHTGGDSIRHTHPIDLPTDGSGTGIWAQVDIPAFNATVDIAPFNGTFAGTATPVSTIQPSIVLLKMIKAK